MADDARIEALRKRLQRDPGSIAFAQLAEECRRAGRFHEAIEVCRAGLARHPGYLSARVTLGRALLEIGDIESAQIVVIGQRPEIHAIGCCPPRNLLWRQQAVGNG